MVGRRPRRRSRWLEGVGRVAGCWVRSWCRGIDFSHSHTHSPAAAAAAAAAAAQAATRGHLRRDANFSTVSGADVDAAAAAVDVWRVVDAVTTASRRLQRRETAASINNKVIRGRAG